MRESTVNTVRTVRLTATKDYSRAPAICIIAGLIMCVFVLFSKVEASTFPAGTYNYSVTDSYSVPISPTSYTFTSTTSLSDVENKIDTWVSGLGNVPLIGGTYQSYVGLSSTWGLMTGDTMYTRQVTLGVLGPGTVTITQAYTAPTQSSPTITWATPEPITYGTALDGTQLSATAFGVDGVTPLLGTFVYIPPATTVLDAGVNQTLSTTFYPTDTTDYTNATSSVYLTVNQAAPSIVDQTNPSSMGSNKTQLLQFNLTSAATSASCSIPLYGNINPSGTVTAGGTYFSWTYTSNSDTATETDGLTFTFANAAGSTYTTCDLTIYPLPTVSGGAASIGFGTSYSGVLSASSLYSSDAFTYNINQPSSGSITNTGSSFTYTPSLGFFGTDSFTYTVLDALEMTSAPATFNITVAGPPATLRVGAGGMVFGAGTLSLIKSTATASPLIIGSRDGSLNNPLTIKTALTGWEGISSTVLNPGVVLRINGVEALTAAQLNARDGIESGFTVAFGIPAPIWGYYNPWVIIAPTNAPAYAFKASAIAAGLATLDSSLGWADGIVPNNGSITSAIVIDPTSLTALVAAMNTATGLSAIGTSRMQSKSGIVNAGGPTGQGGKWNIGVNACGISGGLTVRGSSLQYLLAATNGGQLVVANGATIS